MFVQRRGRGKVTPVGKAALVTAENEDHDAEKQPQVPSDVVAKSCWTSTAMKMKTLHGAPEKNRLTRPPAVLTPARTQAFSLSEAMRVGKTT